jgi:nucleotide-binding universal stress UspA family protein
MKELLTVPTLHSENELGTAAQFTLALARSFGAHLTALITEIEPGLPSPPVEPDIMQGGVEGHKSLSASERLTRIASLVEEAAALAGVPCAMLQEERGSSSLRKVLIDNACVRDLVTLDVFGPLRYPRQGLVEAVLFGTGRPIILVPTAAAPLIDGRILIAWDATRSAVRALHDALPLLKLAQEVVVISVMDDKDFQESFSGKDLCRYLYRWNIDAHFEIAKRGSLTVGAALLEYARGIEADLLVMGGFGHAFERELIFGSATRDIFQSAIELPILLSH